MDSSKKLSTEMTSAEFTTQQTLALDDVNSCDTSLREKPVDVTASEEVEGAGDGTAATDHYLSGVPLYTCIGSLIITMFLMALDQTIVATILTVVGEKFDDFGKINWISSAFMLPMAVLSLSWAKLSMIIGRKYSILLAIVLFELGSLICALANSMNMLIGGRVIAGVGGSGIQVLVLVIITEIVPIQKRGFAQGLVGASFGLASVAGPLVGGTFATYVSWRWCFYINLPFGGIAVLCISYFFNPPFPTGSVWKKLKQIDYIGTALLSAALVLILLALTFGSTEKPWNSAIVISFFTVGGFLLCVFLGWNFYFSKDPLVPWVVVKIPSVVIGCLCFFFFYGAFMCLVLYTTIYFQVGQNQNPFHSGIDLLPLIIPVIIVSIFTGAFISKFRYVKPYILVGSMLGAIGSGVQSLLRIDSSTSQKIGYLIIAGLGSGCLFQSIIISSQLKAPKTNGGVLIATAFLALFRQLGGVVGSTVGQTILTVVLTTKVSQDSSIPESVSSNMTSLINSPTIIHEFPTELRDSILNIFMEAYRGTTYLAVSFFGVCFVLALFTTNMRVPLPAKPREEPATTPEDMA